jgi:phosphopantothenate---cysteine ligase (CTP)
MNVLITGGGCREPVDGVRCITNMSTGGTAARTADRFVAEGDEVTALMAAQSQLPEAARTGQPRLRLLRYETGAELSALIERELTTRAYGAVIHAAAVSDFRPSVITVNGDSFPAGRNAGKIPSGAQLIVTFEPAPKIAGCLRKWTAAGNPGGTTVIVCFKLTDGAGRKERLYSSAVLFDGSSADYVVSNDLTGISNGAHAFEILQKPADEDLPVPLCSGATTEELAERLCGLIHARPAASSTTSSGVSLNYS